MKMLIDREWLAEKIKTDPDLSVEVGDAFALLGQSPSAPIKVTYQWGGGYEVSGDALSCDEVHRLVLAAPVPTDEDKPLTDEEAGRLCSIWYRYAGTKKEDMHAAGMVAAEAYRIRREREREVTEEMVQAACRAFYGTPPAAASPGTLEYWKAAITAALAARKP